MAPLMSNNMQSGKYIIAFYLSYHPTENEPRAPNWASRVNVSWISLILSSIQLGSAMGWRIVCRRCGFILFVKLDNNKRLFYIWKLAAVSINWTRCYMEEKEGYTWCVQQVSNNWLYVMVTMLKGYKESYLRQEKRNYRLPSIYTFS